MEKNPSNDLSHTLSAQQIAQAPINAGLSKEKKIALYREMVRIRFFEEAAVRAYQQSSIGGFCHTYIGQESVAVGSLSVLGADDHVITAYRCHGHALALGMPMNGCMAELFGKATGISKGKGGSMHFFDPSRRFWGGHGIVGAQTPLGAGIAFALKYEGKRGACLCYLGDGAVNQGAYHEALNLAALWELPVIFVIENNHYSMGTSQERSSAGPSLAARAQGYGMSWAHINGKELLTVRAQTADALEYAHSTSHPMILEINTYRYRGHSMSDPDQTYRTKEEIAQYRAEHDCIVHFETLLREEKILQPEDIQSIAEQIRQEVAACVEFAANSPWPTPESIQQDIYYSADNPGSSTNEGTLLFNHLSLG